MIKKTASPATKPGIRRKAMQMNREMIMKTAAGMFAESSYEGTSLNDIAGRIGATKGLIYHYFASKGVLLGELLLWIHDLFLENVEPAYKSSYDHPLDRFKAVVRAHIGFNFQYVQMINIVYWKLDAVPPKMRRKINKLRLAYLSQFNALVEETQASGKLVKGNPGELSVAITTLINYLPFYLRNTDRSKQSSVYDLIIRLFCR